MDYSNLAPNQDVGENGLVFDLGNLYEYLQRISDTWMGFVAVIPKPCNLCSVEYVYVKRIMSCL